MFLLLLPLSFCFLLFFLLLIKTNTDLISSHIDWVDQERPVWEYTRTETVWYKAPPRRRLNGLYSTHRLRSVEPTKICCRLAWILYLELLRPECCDGFSSGFTSIHCGFLFSPSILPTTQNRNRHLNLCNQASLFGWGVGWSEVGRNLVFKSLRSNWDNCSEQWREEKERTSCTFEQLEILIKLTVQNCFLFDIFCN